MKMKKTSKRVILEYRVAKPNRGEKAKWGFRFKTPAGRTLIESGKEFSSLAEAEKGFVSLVKSIATNQYQVSYPDQNMSVVNN